MISAMTRRRLSIVVLFAATLVLDQAHKYWMLEVVGMSHRPPIKICEYFSLVMAWNQGVSFSMFNDVTPWKPYALTVMAAGISGVLFVLASKSHTRLEWLGYGLIIGGALSNALDRLRFGAVADFFYAHIGDLGWPAFNVADMAICLGVGMALLSQFKKPAAA